MRSGVCKLGLGDVDVFRNIRLYGLAESPDAFGQTAEDEQSTPLEWFEKVLQEQHVRGFFQEDRCVAVAAVGAASGLQKTKHKAFLWGVYVLPEVRRKGIGRVLLTHLLQQVSLLFECVQLKVGVYNQEALSLYESLGFKRYGLEERALKTHHGYVDEYCMVLFF